MGNLLEELKQTADSAPVRIEKEKRERLEKEKSLDDIMAHEITFNLIKNLRETANNGKRKYTVLEASLFGDYSKRDRRYHYYDLGKCWDEFGEIRNTSNYERQREKEFIKKVIEQSKGVFKIVYKYCQELKLNPIVRPFDDGVGDDGGYGIYVEW